MSKTLIVNSKIIDNGISIAIDGRDFDIEYPGSIWKKVPKSVRQTLLENLVFGNTHFLPLILDKNKIVYNTPLPFLESFLFRNQLYDMTNSEKADEVKPLSYLRHFYNLDFEFRPGESALPDPAAWTKPKSKKPVAILPFTFGKESLATVALCLELGIEPIVVYCQEPSQPYEEAYKIQKLKEFGRKFKVKTYFIRNAPGLFRYGAAFKKKQRSEIGWGSQTTLLALLSLPFAYAFHAEFILMGNEVSNNEFEYIEGWKMYAAGFDQTSFWTHQQSNMIRMMTGGRCSVKSSLEPLEEIGVFYLLHHRYPELGRYQFSCSAEKPLFKDSQWCHECYKCVRMFLFAESCGIDPYSIGFKKNLLERPELFSHYLGTQFKGGSSQELDFAFYILHKKKSQSPLMNRFVKDKLPHLKPWPWYTQYYSSLHPEENLPDAYRKELKIIFRDSLSAFKKNLPAG